MPHGFSWVDAPRVAAMAHPQSVDDLRWLRKTGIDVIVTLTEDPLPKSWVDEAGVMAVHMPIADMTSPTIQQIAATLAGIRHAHAAQQNVAIHCLAGRGRTGTLAAAYLVSQGLTAKAAIDKIRSERPGSIETPAQEAIIFHWEQYTRANGTQA